MLAVRTSFAPRLMRSFGLEIETYKANLNIRIETDCLIFRHGFGDALVR